MFSRSNWLRHVHADLKLVSNHGLNVIRSQNYSTFVPHDHCPCACGWGCNAQQLGLSALQCEEEMTHRLQASMHDAFQFHGLGTRSRLSRCSRLTAYGGQTRPLGSRLSNSHHHTALKLTLHEQYLLLAVGLPFPSALPGVTLPIITPVELIW